MAVTYFALLTSIGAAKLANAAAQGSPLKITRLAVGDGAGNVPTPDASRTSLVNEVRRAPLNQLSIDPTNNSQIVAEQVIPADAGGWWIREMGLFDESGALIAYANCAPSYKPLLAEGSGRTQTVRMVLIVANTAAVDLKFDASLVVATREYVDGAIAAAVNSLDYKQSVRAATTANIALSGLQNVDGVALVTGDRVLVKNQASGSQNGIYRAATGAWSRAADADESIEVTPSLIVSVESGSTQADTIWQLVTDTPIVLDSTALVFQDITNGLARLASPTFSGSPTAPTPPQFDSGQRLATSAFVQQRIGSLAGVKSVTLPYTTTADDWGRLLIAVGSGTITVADSGQPAGSQLCVSPQLANQSIAIVSANGFSQGGCSLPSPVSLRAGRRLDLVWQNSGNAVIVNGLEEATPIWDKLLAVTGYQKLPSGLIIQWVSGAFASGTSITYPISFPNGFLTGLSNSANTAGWLISSTRTSAIIGHNLGASVSSTIVIVIGY